MTEKERIDFSNANPTALMLKRTYLDKVTTGVLHGYINNILMVETNTIELIYDNNENYISCIPEGIYDVEPDVWMKYNKKVLGIKNVPDRDKILIHPANYASGVHVELRGCIAPVTSYADIDKDGIIDGTNSKKAFDKLMSIFGNVKCKILVYS